MLRIRKPIVFAAFVIGCVSLLYVYDRNNPEPEFKPHASDEALIFAEKNNPLVTDAQISPHQLSQPLVNEHWTVMREVLLKEQNVSKVIILAHARGGSTLCSDIFNIETDNTVLWYEALHGFHSFYSGVPHHNTDTEILYYQNFTRRRVDDAKRNALAKYLTQLMTCDFEGVPDELVSMTPYMIKSATFKDLVACTERKRTFGRFKACQEIISKYCYEQEIRNSPLFVENDSIVSSFKCTELLQSIRRLKLKSVNQFTVKDILRSYFSDQDMDKAILELAVYSYCPEFADRRREDLPPIMRPNSNLRCLNLESKLNLFIKHDQCLEGLHKDILACRHKMEAPCRRSRLTVAEFQRVFMKDLEPFIQQMPDIHVVHYVRDPRAVSVSRTEKHLHMFRYKFSWTPMHESYLLCERMRYDIQHKKRLQQIYPGYIITVRYEDLVLDPRTTVERMYRFFGRPVPRELDNWVKRTIQAGWDSDMYGVQRKNGKLHLSKWRSRVNVDDLDVMNQHCLDVLNEYDYNL